MSIQYDNACVYDGSVPCGDVDTCNVELLSYLLTLDMCYHSHASKIPASAGHKPYVGHAVHLPSLLTRVQLCKPFTAATAPLQPFNAPQ